MLRYTLMRFGIFAGCLVVVWGAVYSGLFPRGYGNANFFWVLLLSLVLSAPISWVVLRKERERASVHVAGRVDRIKANLDANRNQEDGAEDPAAAQGRAS
ncbi:DUF4229 domain-containing protein [Streptomyces sp. IBSBF 2390]|uniref:DUF4229 domain-containing protein n=1 Tax=Streptomyces sp. IBSBF 2390 TaxID=2903533 RepID=UPI002FDBCD53